MKNFRTIILVLLAFLLPIRGAMAATMLCPQAEGPGPAAIGAVHEHHGMEAEHDTHDMHAMHADHSAAHHHGGHDAPDGDPPSGDHPTTCHLCASGCCMASMVGTVASLEAPNLSSPLAFPALTAPVPAFQSDGQDRPPRTI